MKHPGIDDQKVYYDQRWRDAISRPINQFQLKRLISILQMIDKAQLEKKDIKILDFGCGTGWLSSILAHIGSTTGIDLSSEAVSAARKRYSFVDFRAGDIFNIPNMDTYDIVVSQEVIEHVEDQQGYISKVAECLKEGGYLILTTPNAINFNHWTDEELQNWNLQPIERSG